MNSMTGFGAGTAPLEQGTLRVEISGVNRKQTEITINLPRNWASLETGLRQRAAKAISRGRLQLSVSTEQAECAQDAAPINWEKAKELKEQMASLQDFFGRDIALSIESMQRAGIFDSQNASQEDMAAVEKALEAATETALAAFVQMRAEEGQRMKEDLLARIASLRAAREEMMRLADSIPSQYRERLMKRLADADLNLPLEDERLVKEVALFAERCDVSEEMTRLASHLDQFTQMCDKDESLGRSLDFLCQEIFRELNTTGSKANDAALAQLIVQAKTELEKIREQVQNI